MSAPVDVLAVMERETRSLIALHGPSAASDLGQACAAVAELIEANVELAAANADPRHTMGRDLRVITAEKRLAAALARVQGGAA